jgi:acetyl-CoA carboxylase biotin carboxyl carrier protein
MLTDEDVQEIVRLLDELHFDEVHLTTRHFALSLRRSGVDGGWSQTSEVRSTPNVIAAAPAGAADTVVRRTERDLKGLMAVRTPLPGTFYRAPKPGAPSFVEVGDVVEEDTMVAIVETMKLMNSVTAGTRGRVVEICLLDGQFAEQDAALMLIGSE